MNLDAIIRRLAELTEPAGTLVTLTLDVAGSGILPPATRVFLRDVAARAMGWEGRPPAARTALRKLDTRIRRFAADELRPETNGLFLVAGPDVWEVAELAVPLRNSVHIGRSAHLAPLLEARALWPRAFVVTLDAREAVVRQLRLGLWNELGRVRTSALARDTQHAMTGRSVIGGGMRDRFAQSAEEFTATMARHAARKVQGAIGDDPPADLLVFGRDRVAEEFAAHLPPVLRDRLLDAGAPPRDERDLRRTAAKLAAKRVAERTDREVLHFHDRRSQGRLVAIGPAEVFDACDRSAVKRLFLDADNPVEGMKCDGCGRRYAGLKKRCDFCPENLVPVSLAHELIVHGLRHPPLPLTFVPPGATWLREAGGMAALLTARGLRRKVR